MLEIRCQIFEIALEFIKNGDEKFEKYAPIFVKVALETLDKIGTDLVCIRTGFELVSI